MSKIEIIISVSSLFIFCFFIPHIPYFFINKFKLIKNEDIKTWVSAILSGILLIIICFFYAVWLYNYK